MKKPRLRVEFRLSPELKKRILEYAEDQQMTESAAVRQLVNTTLEEYKRKVADENPDTE